MTYLRKVVATLHHYCIRDDVYYSIQHHDSAGETATSVQKGVRSMHMSPLPEFQVCRSMTPTKRGSPESATLPLRCTSASSLHFFSPPLLTPSVNQAEEGIPSFHHIFSVTSCPCVPLGSRQKSKGPSSLHSLANGFPYSFFLPSRAHPSRGYREPWIPLQSASRRRPAGSKFCGSRRDPTLQHPATQVQLRRGGRRRETAASVDGSRRRLQLSTALARR